MPLYTESYEYKECKAIEGILQPAKYKIEAWGAGAGEATGGYASGEIYIKYPVPYFIHIGAAPVRGNPSEGGCNGGGSGNTTKPVDFYGGGGATDIRFFEDTIYHRVLVAGGAGGCYDAIRNPCGGGGPGCNIEMNYGFNPGKFGYGGNSTLTPYGGGGGGGGGWEGGASIAITNDVIYCGNGGTSFVLNSTAITPSEYALSTRHSVFFETGVLIRGIEPMPSFNGTGTEIGHSGNGAFRITILKTYDYFCSQITQPIFLHYFIYLTHIFLIKH